MAAADDPDLAKSLRIEERELKAGGLSLPLDVDV